MVEIELANQKKVTINEFKGRKLLDIRNYYEKDGEQRPTQKGISLTPEQWLKLLHNKDEISKALGIDPSIDFEERESEEKPKQSEGKPKANGETKESGEPKEKVKKEPKVKRERSENESEKSPKKKKLSPDTVDPEDLAQDVE